MYFILICACLPVTDVLFDWHPGTCLRERVNYVEAYDNEPL